MSRDEAVEIINRMPYLVCSSHAKLLTSMFSEETRDHYRRHGQSKRTEKPAIIVTTFTVYEGKRQYTFEAQPFRVLRLISRQEFRRVAPWAAVGRFHYEVATD